MLLVKLKKRLNVKYRQVKQKKKTRGNVCTRSREGVTGETEHSSFNMRNEATKFYKRPPGNSNHAVWRKYPTPFLYKNPFPEGGIILTRRFYQEGWKKRLEKVEEKVL